MSLYLGFDYGANWTVLNVNAVPYTSLACSENGKYVAATSSEGVSLSDDRGVTFRTQTITTSNGVGWGAVAMNISGSFKLAGMAHSGGIYLGTLNYAANATSASPSFAPSVAPTISPTEIITLAPTVASSASPSLSPTEVTTSIPTASPTVPPSDLSTLAPSVASSAAPSIQSTASPTAGPTIQPTLPPTAASGTNSNGNSGLSNKETAAVASVVVVFVVIGLAGFVYYAVAIKGWLSMSSNMNAPLIGQRSVDNTL